MNKFATKPKRASIGFGRGFSRPGKRDLPPGLEISPARWIPRGKFAKIVTEEVNRVGERFRPRGHDTSLLKVRV